MKESFICRRFGSRIFRVLTNKTTPSPFCPYNPYMGDPVWSIFWVFQRTSMTQGPILTSLLSLSFVFHPSPNRVCVVLQMYEVLLRLRRLPLWLSCRNPWSCESRTGSPSSPFFWDVPPLSVRGRSAWDPLVPEPWRDPWKTVSKVRDTWGRVKKPR